MIKILERNASEVQLRCLGKSINQSLPVKMFMMDATEGLVDVEDQLVAAKRALGRPACGASGEGEDLAASSPSESEEVEIKKWVPAGKLEPGTKIEEATATYVDWSGRVHLVQDMAKLGFINDLLAFKYSNSKWRPGKFNQSWC